MKLLLLPQTTIYNPVYSDEVQLRVWECGMETIERRLWGETAGTWRALQKCCVAQCQYGARGSVSSARNINIHCILLTSLLSCNIYITFTLKAGLQLLEHMHLENVCLIQEGWPRCHRSAASTSTHGACCVYTSCIYRCGSLVVATAHQHGACFATDSADCWCALTDCSVGDSGVCLQNRMSCCSYHSPALPAWHLFWF